MLFLRNEDRGNLLGFRSSLRGLFKQPLRPLALLATAAFSATQMVAFVLYPYFAEAMQLPLSAIISSFSLGSLLFLWASPYWARCSERIGPKTVLAVGLGGLLCAQLILLFLALRGTMLAAKTTASLLWGSRIAYGLTAAAVVPVAQTIMAASSASGDRMQAMTRHGIALQIGRLVGPLLVWLGLLHSAVAPLWLCAGLIASLLMLLLGAREQEGLPRQALVNRSWSWPAAGQSRLLLTVAFGVTCLVGMIQSSLTRSMQQHLHLDALAAAHLTLRFLLASSLFSIVVQTLVQARIKHPWQGTLPAGALCLILSTGLLARFQSEQELWWALPLFSCGLALLTPSYTAALSLQQGMSQAQAAGLLAAVHTLGYAAGGFFCAGLMASALPPLLAALGLAILLLPVVLILKSPSVLAIEFSSRGRR